MSKSPEIIFTVAGAPISCEFEKFINQFLPKDAELMGIKGRVVQYKLPSGFCDELTFCAVQKVSREEIL